MESKFVVGFIASIIRYELEQAAKKADKSTNGMIEEMGRMAVTERNRESGKEQNGGCGLIFMKRVFMPCNR